MVYISGSMGGNNVPGGEIAERGAGGVKVSEIVSSE